MRMRSGGGVWSRVRCASENVRWAIVSAEAPEAKEELIPRTGWSVKYPVNCWVRGPMTIRGTTELIAHIGFPTHGFKSPLIYNPYFEEAGIDVVVMPMGCRTGHFPAFLRAVFTLENIRGALITMPHKQTCATL